MLMIVKGKAQSISEWCKKKKSNLKCIDNYTSVAICVVVKLDSRIKLFAACLFYCKLYVDRCRVL